MRPVHTSRVHAIHVAPGRKVPTRSVQQVEAEEGLGLVGDRYHGTRHRHVTLQALDDLEAAAAELGRPVDPALTRRNVTITRGPVPTRPGALLRIGDVQLQVVRLAAPCRLLDDWLGPGAMRAMHARGGTVCRLLGSGTIRVGDVVQLDPVDVDADPVPSGRSRRRTLP